MDLMFLVKCRQHALYAESQGSPLRAVALLDRLIAREEQQTVVYAGIIKLFAAAKGEAFTSKEIAAKLGKKHATVSTELHNLSDRGYLTRVPEALVQGGRHFLYQMADGLEEKVPG